MSRGKLIGAVTALGLVAGAVSGAAGQQLQRPAVIEWPTSAAECDQLRKDWADYRARIDRLHEDCLQAAGKNRKVTQSLRVCSVSGCQSLHDELFNVGNDLQEEAIRLCDQRVAERLEAERRLAGNAPSTGGLAPNVARLPRAGAAPGTARPPLAGGSARGAAEGAAALSPFQLEELRQLQQAAANFRPLAAAGLDADGVEARIAETRQRVNDLSAYLRTGMSPEQMRQWLSTAEDAARSALELGTQPGGGGLYRQDLSVGAWSRTAAEMDAGLSLALRELRWARYGRSAAELASAFGRFVHGGTLDTSVEGALDLVAFGVRLRRSAASHVRVAASTSSSAFAGIRSGWQAGLWQFDYSLKHAFDAHLDYAEFERQTDPREVARAMLRELTPGLARIEIGADAFNRIFRGR
jgi:hypothetical protein